jgi:hypothetical protein
MLPPKSKMSGINNGLVAFIKKSSKNLPIFQFNSKKLNEKLAQEEEDKQSNTLQAT